MRRPAPLTARLLAASVFIGVTLAAVPAFAQGTTTTPPTTPTEQTPGFVPVIAPELFDRGAAILDAVTSGAPLDPAELDRALFDLTTSIYLNPGFSEAYYARALVHIGRQDAEAAEADLARAIEVLPPDDPNYAAALFSLQAELLRELDRLDEALEAYTAGIAAAPNSARLYANRALVYLNQSNAADAVQDLDRAIALDDENALLYLYRAVAYSDWDLPTSPARAAADYYAFLQGIETTSTNGGRIAANDPQVVEMTQGALFTYTLNAKAGDIWTIRAEARPGDPVDPLLVLLDPEGEAVAADDDSGGGDAEYNAQITRFVIPTDGRYTIVLGHSLGGSEGLVAVGALLAE